MEKSPQAFRTISEVAQWLETPAHVLRFWESRFPEIAPVKRAGGRRYYRPEDMRLLGGIKHLLHSEGHTIKSVQDRLRAEGLDAVSAFSQPLSQEQRQNGSGAPSGAQRPPEPAMSGTDILADAGPGDAPAALRRPADDDELPPIGFFFDDSEDALPAKDQSGTFAPDLLDADPPEHPAGDDVAEAPAPSDDAPQAPSAAAAVSAAPDPVAPAQEDAAQAAPDDDGDADAAGSSAAMPAVAAVPPDPADNAPLATDPIAPLPMAWELRALDPDALRPDDRRALKDAAKGLQALRDRPGTAPRG